MQCLFERNPVMFWSVLSLVFLIDLRLSFPFSSAPSSCPGGRPSLRVFWAGYGRPGNRRCLRFGAGHRGASGAERSVCCDRGPALLWRTGCGSQSGKPLCLCSCRCESKNSTDARLHILETLTEKVTFVNTPICASCAGHRVYMNRIEQNGPKCFLRHVWNEYWLSFSTRTTKAVILTSLAFKKKSSNSVELKHNHLIFRDFS